MRQATPIILGAAMALQACGANTDSTTTMAMLHAGDAKVCTAYDVQETLRSAIRPKGGTGSYTISLSAEVLEAFDAAVSRASCRANIKIEGPSGTLTDSTIDYAVLPSASNPGDFGVSAPTDLLRARLAQQISDDAQSKQDQAAQTAEQSRLTALVKPGWLIGRWVEANQGSNACLDGPYLDFGRRNLLRGPNSIGTWRLNGFDLQMITAGSAATVTIADADAMTFQVDSADGPLETYRRCTKDDEARVMDEVQREYEQKAERSSETTPDDHRFDPNVPSL